MGGQEPDKTRTGNSALKKSAPKRKRAASNRNGIRPGPTLGTSAGTARERSTQFSTRANSLWKRLKCRNKWPRCWWYPLHNQSTESPAEEATQKRYEGCVETVRGTMLAILSFCLFSFVTVVGTPDSALIASEAKIKMPLADTEIAFMYFLVGAIFLLVVLTLYLHIFDTDRRELESRYKISPVSTLFTLNRPLPNALCKFTFYWLVPIVLAAITWKALARLWWGLPLLAVTIAVTGALVWMQIRRCPPDRRLQRNLPLWIVLIGLASVACFAVLHIGAFRRPLNLFRANLSEKWLGGAELRDADLRSASLRGADLSRADLRGADLSVANLQGADLKFANLQGADLRHAQLQAADLRNAELQGADLREAQLQGAALSSAKVLGADLRGAALQGADLTRAQLQAADLRNAELQGADLSFTNLQGADLASAKILLASVSDFPRDLINQSPAPLGLPDMIMSSLTTGAKEQLKRYLKANIIDPKILSVVIDRLDQVLQEPPNQEGGNSWRESWLGYVRTAEEPPADQIALLYAGLACEDTEGYIANSMAVRAKGYTTERFRKGYAKLLARALLNWNCKGGKALTDETRAALQEPSLSARVRVEAARYTLLPHSH